MRAFHYCAAAGLALAITVSVAARNPQFEGADPHAMMIGDEMWIFPTGGPGGRLGAGRFDAVSSRDPKDCRERCNRPSDTQRCRP